MKKCLIMAKRYGLVEYVLGDTSRTVAPQQQQQQEETAKPTVASKDTNVPVSSKVELRSTSKKSLKRKTPLKTKKKKKMVMMSPEVLS